MSAFFRWRLFASSQRIRRGHRRPRRLRSNVHGWPIVAEADLKQMMVNQMRFARVLDFLRNSVDFIEALGNLVGSQALRTTATGLLNRAIEEGPGDPTISELVDDPAALTSFTRQYARGLDVARALRESAVPVDPAQIDWSTLVCRPINVGNLRAIVCDPNLRYTLYCSVGLKRVAGRDTNPVKRCART